MDSAEEKALTVIGLATERRFDEIRDLFAEQLRPMVSAEAFRAQWDAEVGRLGGVSAVGQPTAQAGPQHMTVVTTPVTCERGALNVVVALLAGGELTGIQLVQATGTEARDWDSPEYADPARFREEEVRIGSGPLAVGGTLSIPTGSGPFPAVLLLAGSGPNDRDGTVGQRRPLKDIAWGLASRGIVALRFEKTTYAHPAEAKANPAFTLVDEYVRDAAAALELLRARPEVETRRIVLAGHSLGGTVAPRVAAADTGAAEGGLAGLVLLAGGAEPLQWSIVRQTRYLASLHPETAEAMEPVIAQLAEQARRVDSPELSPSTPSGELPFGTPAAYWLDLRSYTAPEVAASLGLPMLVLQGGKDYQATVEGDLARWRTALEGRPDVTIRVYPADDHFFVPVDGPPAPPDLTTPAHVDAAVIGDIVDWML